MPCQGICVSVDLLAAKPAFDAGVGLALCTLVIITSPQSQAVTGGMLREHLLCR
jgi:hypothetical protein